MPSQLRNEISFAPSSAHSTQASSPVTSPRPQKKQKMTITQTYRLAHSARGKLSSQASRGDHDLRLLVGHANLLDSLMVEIQDAENEQEEWFNETMQNASPKSPEESQHIQWRDELASQHQLDIADDERDSDDEDDSDDEFEIPIPSRRIRSPPPTITTVEIDDEEEDDDSESDDDYCNLELALVRTQSHSSADVLPELVHDNSDDSDDESSSPPTTPPQVSIELPSQPQKLQQKSEQAILEEEGYFIPSNSRAPLIAAY